MKYLLTLILLILTGCSSQMNKPYSDTSTGRAKKDYYNSIEFGDRQGTVRYTKRYNSKIKKQARRRQR